MSKNATRNDALIIEDISIKRGGLNYNVNKWSNLKNKNKYICFSSSSLSFLFLKFTFIFPLNNIIIRALFLLQNFINI